MKRPKNRNARIDRRRLRLWANEFANYCHSVSEDRIREWIGQFDEHSDLAARVLDCIKFVTHDQIVGAFRSVLRGLEGWSVDKNDRIGTWRFIPYSVSAGESGDSMLTEFRHANNLAGTKYNDLFICRSDILRARLGPDDTVVLIDDFAGSGDQACESWSKHFGELLAEVGRVYLVVVAAYPLAVTRIADETELELVSDILLTEADNVFSSACRYFTSMEKKALLEFCTKADSKEPKGYGDCGLLVVFKHTCPNDSIPVLHKVNKKWEGLFRRYN
ncbi:MAG: hypothetical protein IID44_26245 [Planctomycetes bacterium]|nr:hypothetical protein [Planctomycetota bacterium]